jgi:hypothetical protein
MTFSGVDWTILWKLYHYQFFWLYLTIGIPLRFVVARRFGTASIGKTNLRATIASFASSVLNTWVPIVPIAAALVVAQVDGGGSSVGAGVPLVALSMAAEGALLDVLIFRILMGKSGINRLVALLVVNILNASIALSLSLAWIRHNPPHIIALRAEPGGRRLAPLPHLPSLL